MYHSTQALLHNKVLIHDGEISRKYLYLLSESQLDYQLPEIVLNGDSLGNL